MAVSVQDVATTLQRQITDPAQVAAVELWIRQAMMQVRLRFGARVAELDPDAVDYAVLEAVAERFRAPSDAVSSTSLAVDDATVTKRWEQRSGRSGAMPDAWLDWLAAQLPGGSGEAFSIRLASPQSGGRCAW